MNKKIKALIYNFLAFTVFYLPSYLLLMNFTTLKGLWIASSSFLVTLIFSPKFQAVSSISGDKIFMKWIFKKGIKEIK